MEEKRGESGDRVCCRVVGVVGVVGGHCRPMKAVDVGASAASSSSERWTTIAKTGRVTGFGFKVEVFSPSAAL